MNVFSKRHPNKRIFISGGASGIGQATAYRFAKAGWKVAIADIHEPRMAETAEEISKLGGEPLSFKLDVSKEDDWLKARDGIEEAWGGIDILFNNAGIGGVAGAFEVVGTQAWQQITQINYWSVVFGCQTFMPMLKQQGSGHIINNASVAGIITAADMGPYSATKAAVIAMSEVLHKELTYMGINVSVVCPTVVKTNLGESLTGDSKAVNAIIGQVNRSQFSADDAVHAILKGVKKKRLYIFTRPDGYCSWLMKRFMPQTTSKLVAWGARKQLWMFR